MFTYSNKNLKQPPGVGEMREVIAIGRTVSVLSENGYPVSQDEYLYRVKSAMQESGYGAGDGAGGEIFAHGRNYLMRTILGLEPGMWLEHDGLRFAMVDIAFLDVKKRYIGIRVQSNISAQG